MLEIIGKMIIGFQLLRIAKVDWENGKISNKSLLVLFLLGSIYIVLFDRVSTDKIIGILSVSMPMLFITLLWAGSFGGGDIKLMAIAGMLLGHSSIIKAFFFALLIASVYCIWLIGQGKGRKTTFPLGPFLCGGIIMGLLEIF